MSKVKQKQMQRRTEILEAAIPLISSTAFDELSVADICSAAGISVGTFYHYFDKKSDVLIGLLSIIDESLEADVFPRLNNENEMENLKIFAHAWAEHVDKHGIERSRLISSVRPSDADFMGQRRIALVKLEEIIGRGQDKGQITKAHSTTTLAEYFLLAFRAVTTDWTRYDGSYSITEKMDNYIAFFMRALKP